MLARRFQACLRSGVMTDDNKIMRSIAKSYVSERLCLEPLYKERIIQRVSNRYNLKQNSRRNKKKPSSLFWTGLD